MRPHQVSLEEFKRRKIVVAFGGRDEDLKPVLPCKIGGYARILHKMPEDFRNDGASMSARQRPGNLGHALSWSRTKRFTMLEVSLAAAEVIVDHRVGDAELLGNAHTEVLRRYRFRKLQPTSDDGIPIDMHAPGRPPTGATSGFPRCVRPWRHPLTRSFVPLQKLAPRRNLQAINDAGSTSINSNVNNAVRSGAA